MTRREGIHDNFFDDVTHAAVELGGAGAAEAGSGPAGRGRGGVGAGRDGAAPARTRRGGCRPGAAEPGSGPAGRGRDGAGRPRALPGRGRRGAARPGAGGAAGRGRRGRHGRRGRARAARQARAARAARPGAGGAVGAGEAGGAGGAGAKLAVRAFLVYIAFFPEGAERDDISHNSGKSVSTFIYLDQPLTHAGVKARFELNLVLPNGKPVPWDNVVIVAADKYGLESRLCSHIELKTVATTLSLADRHGCSSLKEACVKFIMYRGNLKSLMKTSDFEYLRTSCPALVNEFLAKVVT
ncbi:hypothetical protein BDA96_05G207000 [Sorghum bicolor]|uniref:BPM/SPOP BACK domain-containing protein n=1 Tax=Sorghum bicolor TaxID=4558 RepID=A0A921R1Q3_SORBI|nr:hypothetical protein BDA96_05G207000 [Sorghum bicolor]